MKVDEISMSAALGRALEQILNEDPKSFLMGEDIGVYGGAFKITRGFAEKYPGRIIDTPISENGFTSMACGAALMGSRPIIEIMFMDFLALAMDAVINVAVKWQEIYGDQYQMPIIIRCPAGAGRSYGPTHSQSFEGILQNIPNLVICCPSDATSAAELLLGAYENKKPTIFIEHKALYARKAPVPEILTPAPIGQAKIIKPGKDLSLITYGRHLTPSLELAQEMDYQGISIEVIDLRTIKPIDQATIIESVNRTGKALIIEESPVIGGIGGEISAIIMQNCFEYIEAPVKRLGAAEMAIPCNPKMETNCFPSPQKITDTIHELLTYGA